LTMQNWTIQGGPSKEPNHKMLVINVTERQPKHPSHLVYQRLVASIPRRLVAQADKVITNRIPLHATQAEAMRSLVRKLKFLPSMLAGYVTIP
jgi:hypothetical protein